MIYCPFAGRGPRSQTCRRFVHSLLLCPRFILLYVLYPTQLTCFLATTLAASSHHAAIKTETVRDSRRSEKSVDALHLEELHQGFKNIIFIPGIITNTNQCEQEIITTNKSGSHGRRPGKLRFGLVPECGQRRPQLQANTSGQRSQREACRWRLGIRSDGAGRVLCEAKQPRTRTHHALECTAWPRRKFLPNSSERRHLLTRSLYVETSCDARTLLTPHSCFSRRPRSGLCNV